MRQATPPPSPLIRKERLDNEQIKPFFRLTKQNLCIPTLLHELPLDIFKH